VYCALLAPLAVKDSVKLPLICELADRKNCPLSWEILVKLKIDGVVTIAVLTTPFILNTGVTCKLFKGAEDSE
jgi:hypothetical protein